MDAIVGNTDMDADIKATTTFNFRGFTTKFTTTIFGFDQSPIGM